MQSLFREGRYLCTGCRRYKTDEEVERKPQNPMSGRLYCRVCGQQVRLRARTMHKPAKESRAR